MVRGDRGRDGVQGWGGLVFKRSKNMIKRYYDFKVLIIFKKK